MKIRNDGSAEIDIIDLGVQRPETARIMVVQARTKPEFWGEQKGLCFYKEKKKVAEFLEWVMSQAARLTVDALILPELSVPEDLVPQLQAWSEQSGAIAIAGSHYFRSKHRGFISRAPIIVSGKIYYTEKISPAPAEISPIEGEGLTPGNKLCLFRNSTIGTFAVFICSDYLEQSIKNPLFKEDLDIAFISAFQKDSSAYHSRISIDVEESFEGTYVAYANMYCSLHGDGRSAFFGQMDKMYLDKLKAANQTDLNPPWKICELSVDTDFIVAECSLLTKRPFAKRTVKTKPNIRVIEAGSRKNKSSVQFTQRVAQYDERYSQIEELFVPPSEYNRMTNLLEERRLLFIIGDPGIGKTYTAARLLKHYFDLHYEPIWYAGLERTDRVNQRRILENFQPQTDQVVYFEDPFGRTSFERRDSISRIFGPLSDHLKQIDARVIVTSRREIFDQFTKESVTAVDLDEFTQEMNVVKPSYLPGALQLILSRIAKDTSWYNSSECLTTVCQAIDQGKLRTPLSIRDFVFSTAHISLKESLLEHIDRRGIEETRLFSLEMEACRIRTKLALAIVFLFGNQTLATLSEWFNHVGRFLDPSSEHWSGTAPILTEMRNQMGYRIEQYGYKYIGLRFIHPRYEEAFAELVDRDPITLDIISSVLKYVARQNLMTAIQGTTIHANKYPELAVNLLNHLVPVIRSQANLAELSLLGLKLYGTFTLTGSRGFKYIIDKIIELEQIALKINIEKDLYATAQALRFVNHYGSALRASGKLPSQWRQTFSEKLDFEAIWNCLFSETKFSKVAEALIWLSKFRHQSGTRFLSSLPEQELLLRFRTLPISERVRLADVILQGSIVGRLLRKSLDSNEEQIPREGIKQWLFEFAAPEVGIVIDDGAVEAIQKGYSLLPVGVIAASGEFDRNHTVAILNSQNLIVAVGIAAYSSQEIESIKGLHSSLINTVLGYNCGPGVIRSRAMAYKE